MYFKVRKGDYRNSLYTGKLLERLAASGESYAELARTATDELHRRRLLPRDKEILRGSIKYALDNDVHLRRTYHAAFRERVKNERRTQRQRAQDVFREMRTTHEDLRATLKNLESRLDAAFAPNDDPVFTYFQAYVKQYAGRAGYERGRVQGSDLYELFFRVMAGERAKDIGKALGVYRLTIFNYVERLAAATKSLGLPELKMNRAHARRDFSPEEGDKVLELLKTVGYTATARALRVRYTRVRDFARRHGIEQWARRKA
ncbi:MAG TPA: hypothetical protein VLJ21_04520 [Candidatus Binatia bacterium]|nr:hypothetical protein [Candidatus Binatia bacterium]